MKIRLGALIAALSSTFALIPAAHAAGPPKGKYGCVSNGYIYHGDLYVLSDNRYRLNRSKVGKFTTRGRKLYFKSGIYKGEWKFGRWYFTSDKRWEIALTRPDGFESTYCTKER